MTDPAREDRVDPIGDDGRVDRGVLVGHSAGSGASGSESSADDRVVESAAISGAAEEGRSAPARGGGVVKWRPRPLKITVAASGAFLAVMGLLTWQLAVGDDPALGTGQSAVPESPAPVKRKVIVTRVIHDPPPRPRAQAGAPPAGAPASPPAAPVQAAPAPAPAPPPPPPPVTQAS